jgi:uncharacterized protein (TIGR03382 family)
MLWLLLSTALALDTPSLVADLDGDVLQSLTSVQTGASWLRAPTALYEGAAGLDTELTHEALPDGQLLLRLALTNPSDDPVQTTVTFPTLRGIEADVAAPLTALFPGRTTLQWTDARYVEQPYGALFPLQWLAVDQGSAGALWVMTRDTTGQDKAYGLETATDGSADLVVGWFDLAVAPGETITLEASIGLSDDDWHAALAAYRRWVASWYRPEAPRQPAFQHAWHLRQVHLHDNAVLGSHPGAFDPDTQGYTLQDFLDEDVAAFGGVDWVHLFDWGMDWQHGRVGDYNPWAYLGDRQAFVEELDALQDQGIGVGLYTEGYLLDTPSLTGLRSGDSWDMTTATGEPYTNFAPSWHMCPAVPDWREHYAVFNARRSARRTGANGLYADQFGYGYQYACHRDDHGHGTPSLQVSEEWGLLQAVRAELPPDQVLYTEAAPADVVTQTQDGAFVEAVAAFRHDPDALPVHMARFALPDHKTFELLVQDAPLGDDVEGIRLTFFSGEGIRLMGYLEDDAWFGDESLAELRRTWGALTAHAETFSSDDVTPLVETADASVLANRFTTDQDRVWTLLNTGSAPVSGVVLTPDDRPGATYGDCLTGDALVPAITDGQAQLTLALDPGDIGCLVQAWPAGSPTLVAHWALDESSGSAGLTDAVTGSMTGATDAQLGQPSALSEQLGTAARLDGVDDQASLGTGPWADLTADFTVSAWVRPDDTSGARRVLAVDGWTDGGWVFAVTDGLPVLTTVGVHDAIGSAPLTPGRWTHLAAVVDGGSTVTFYLDGEARDSVSHATPGQPSASDWWLGSNGTDGFWSGGLDDVKVYDGALTRDQVRRLADLSAPLAGTVTAESTRATDDVVRQHDALTLRWPGFHDAQSGIAGYRVALGSTASADDLSAWTDLGAAVQHTFTDLALPTAVHASVEAINGAGQTTTASTIVTVDPSPPALLGAWDLLPEDDAIDLELEVPLGSVSVTAWIYPTATVAMTLLGSDDGGWALGLGGDGDDLHFVTPGVQDYVLPASIPLGAWTHVAAVFDSWTDVTFYVDGELAGVVHGAVPAAATGGPVTLGGRARPWVGALLDVQLYDGELSPDQLEALLAADTGDTAGTVPDTGTPDSATTPEDTGVLQTDDGCGCGSPGVPGGWPWLLGLLALTRRRDLYQVMALGPP